MPEILTDQLRLMAEHYGPEVACTNVTTNEEMTFAEWEGRSNQLARWLAAQGVEKGDRVAIHIPPEHPFFFLISYSAVHKAGAVAVPLNTRLVEREVDALLEHSGAKIVLRADNLVFEGDDTTFQVPLSSTDIADIMYTSGTTGRPKGVVVRHGNVALVPNALPPKVSPKGWLHASPMFTFAGISSTYNPMKMGMQLLYMPRFDVDAWFDVVEQRQPRATFVVPAMAELLIKSPRFDDADLSSLRICSLGSAPVAPATVKRLQDKMPRAMVSNAWGMTEAGPAFCFMPEEERDKRVGSVGKPMPPTVFKVVDEDGNERPAREIGELLISNPGREREYFNDPDATASTWRDGWLHSGDLAFLDEDGFLYIVGRAKEVIIRGGNNVHASDVESVLYEHPAVQEVAVASIPHDVLGEDVGAWIVLADAASVTEDELKAFCAERLSDYKVPRRYTFVDELPRNATGKVVKKDLPGRS
ncbi:MAG: long-chain acyl-CoA synthetase [Actinomycetota bacterium]|jgi:acyl-CoA synthetase (AMP-forming)/AMP-acid ligase II